MDKYVGMQTDLSELEFNLLDKFQRNFPLSARPYAELAARLGTDEETVIETLADLKSRKFISRIGAVVAPHKAGWSTLAAISAPEHRLIEIANSISARPEVNHNYEREHDYNLWFVVAAADREAVAQVIGGIEAETGLPVIELPLVEAYHLDLGFPLS